MKKILENNKETIVQLESSDIESAIRQFICSCYPELALGYVCNPEMPEMTLNVICERDKKLVKNNQCCYNPEIIQTYETRPSNLKEQLIGNYRIIFKCKNCGKPSLF